MGGVLDAEYMSNTKKRASTRITRMGRIDTNFGYCKVLDITCVRWLIHSKTAKIKAQTRCIRIPPPGAIGNDNIRRLLWYREISIFVSPKCVLFLLCDASKASFFFITSPCLFPAFGGINSGEGKNTSLKRGVADTSLQKFINNEIPPMFFGGTTIGELKWNQK